MASRRQAGMVGILVIARRIPWWVSVASALVVYIALHHVATMEISKPQGMKGFVGFEARTLYKTLAVFGQYIIPLALLAGAVMSAASSRLRGFARSMMRRDPATLPARVEPKLSGLDLERDNHSARVGHELSQVKPEAWSLELLSNIEWKRFEDLCAEYYREKGIRCETTPLGADGGIDLKLYQGDSGKPTTIVQCKAWVGRLVGVKLVRELRGVMASENIEKGFFMTSSAYSQDAKEFARSNNITLIDAKLFLMMIMRLPREARDRLLSFTTKGDYTTPTCPACGIKMVRRDGSRGAFWGCKSYPRCRQILSIGRHGNKSKE